MKKVILMLAIVSMTTLTYANRTFNTAKEYSSYLTGHTDLGLELFHQTLEKVNTDYKDMLGVLATFDVCKNQCLASIAEIENENMFANGETLKAACLDLLNHYTCYGTRVLVTQIVRYNSPIVTNAELDESMADMELFTDELTTKMVNFFIAQIAFEKAHA